MNPYGSDTYGSGAYGEAGAPPLPERADNSQSWSPLLLDDVLYGGPRASPFPPTNRGDNNPARIGRYD